MARSPRTRPAWLAPMNGTGASTRAGDTPSSPRGCSDRPSPRRRRSWRARAPTSTAGNASVFEVKHGYYLDPVSPHIATLPADWESRLVRIELEPSLAAWFLEPHDAAVSKYARLEPRDREWIRAGLSAKLLSLAILEARMAATAFLDREEPARAREALIDDRRWLSRRPHECRDGLRNWVSPSRRLQIA